MSETASWETTLDRGVRSRCRNSLKRLWDDDHGLSDEDVNCAALNAAQIYLDWTDHPAAECVERAVEIAFDERFKLVAERV